MIIDLMTDYIVYNMLIIEKTPIKVPKFTE